MAHRETAKQTDPSSSTKVYELAELAFCFNAANLVVIKQLSESLWMLSISCLSF